MSTLKLVPSTFVNPIIVESDMHRTNITFRHKDRYHPSAQHECFVQRATTTAEGWVHVDALKSIFVVDGIAHLVGEYTQERSARAFFAEYSSIPGAITMNNRNFYVYANGLIGKEEFDFFPNGYSKEETVANVRIVAEQSRCLVVSNQGMHASLTTATPVLVDECEVGYLLRESYTHARTRGWVKWSVVCPLRLDFNLAAAVSSLLRSEGESATQGHPSWTVAKIRSTPTKNVSIMDIFLAVKA